MVLARVFLFVLSLLFLLGCPDNRPARQSPNAMNGDDTVYGDASGGSASDDSLDDQVIREDPSHVPDGSVDSSNLEIMERDRRSGPDLDWGPVLFEFDQASLSAYARKTLTRYGETLKRFPELRVLIEGHCDTRGTEDYNLALGERRAQAVKRFLAELGVSETNLRTISYGEIRPLIAGESETAWAKNRRVSFTF